MGFPVGYSDLYLPEWLVFLLTVLVFLRNFVRRFFSLLGLRDFVDPLAQTPQHPSPVEPAAESRSVSAVLIRELLPVVRFSELADMESPESCVVCLYEFASEDEIRRLWNCRHVFHRSCVDRWMDHDQKTCPLCRTQLIPEEMQEACNQRLWAADSYGGNSTVPTGL